MRTLGVCDVSDEPFHEPFQLTAATLGLGEARRDLAELGRTLDFIKVSKREKDESLTAFAADKDEVTASYRRR
ncbi:hypothetical protein SM0020_03930 [Sinorhizobium meliloti CCNWSX0020]|uniref:Uncharacterized protein n=2 Tax=Rhizobium meliloti TaxID=382 RepID=H0FUE6_RHIML|nr:hypothetical protein SM0020_03930 [Sinorhizobium meliloti CCNWSX0020]